MNYYIRFSTTRSLGFDPSRPSFDEDYHGKSKVLRDEDSNSEPLGEKNWPKDGKAFLEDVLDVPNIDMEVKYNTGKEYDVVFKLGDISPRTLPLATLVEKTWSNVKTTYDLDAWLDTFMDVFVTAYSEDKSRIEQFYGPDAYDMVDDEYCYHWIESMDSDLYEMNYHPKMLISVFKDGDSVPEWFDNIDNPFFRAA